MLKCYGYIKDNFFNILLFYYKNFNNKNPIDKLKMQCCQWFEEREKKENGGMNNSVKWNNVVHFKNSSMEQIIKKIAYILILPVASCKTS